MNITLNNEINIRNKKAFRSYITINMKSGDSHRIHCIEAPTVIVEKINDLQKWMETILNSEEKLLVLYLDLGNHISDCTGSLRRIIIRRDEIESIEIEADLEDEETL